MLIPAIVLALIAANAGANQSHCSEHEQVIFSCSIVNSAKIASLCASKKLAKGRGSVSYRFGPLEKIELEFPPVSKGSIRHFRHAHYFRFQTDRTEVSFSIGKFNYTLFDYYDGEEKQKYARGVRVANQNREGRETELLCSGLVKADLQKLEGVVPCDADNALASCN